MVRTRLRTLGIAAVAVAGMAIVVPSTADARWGGWHGGWRGGWGWGGVGLGLGLATGFALATAAPY